jgi:MFS family permease
LRSDHIFNLPIIGLTSWLLCVLFFLYEFFIRTSIGAISGHVMSDFSLGATQFALLGTVYAIAYGSMQIPAGIIIDCFGVCRSLVVAMLVCAAGTYGITIATNFTELMLARFIIGVGSSFAFIGLLIIIRMWLPAKYFTSYVGFSQTIGTIGPIIAGGPLVYLIQQHDNHWRSIVVYVAVFGLVLSLLSIFFLRQKSIKIAGDRSVYWREMLAMFQNKQVLRIAFYSGATYVPIFLLGVVWGTPFLTQVGLSQGQAASAVSLCWVGYAVGCPLLGYWSDYTSNRGRILCYSAALGAVVSLLMLVVNSTDPLYWSLIFFVLGVAVSGQNIAFAAITNLVLNRQRATAIGFNNASLSLFDATIPLAVGATIHFFKLSNISAHTSYILAFLVLPLLFIAALLVAKRHLQSV